MALIFDISFPEGFSDDYVQIPAGQRTQVRHELGCGGGNVAATGKLERPMVFFSHELGGRDAHLQVNKDLEKFTGLVEANMGMLFFQDGVMVAPWLTLYANPYSNQFAWWNIDRHYRLAENFNIGPLEDGIQHAKTSMLEMVERIKKDLQDETSQIVAILKEKEISLPSWEPGQVLKDPYCD